MRQEIFELLFETANISKFAPEDKTKYEYDMTTERDIRNQIRYAEKRGREEGREEQAIETARRMLADKMPFETIARYSGLSEDEVRAL